MNFHLRNAEANLIFKTSPTKEKPAIYLDIGYHFVLSPLAYPTSSLVGSSPPSPPWSAEAGGWLKARQEAAPYLKSKRESQVGAHLVALVGGVFVPLF